MLKVICVSGCVGSGKSTLLKQLAETQPLLELGSNTYKVEVDLENVELWQSEGLLESVYQDAALNGFFFQTFVLVEFAEKFRQWKQKAQNNWIQNKHNTLVLCERCPFECKNVFMHLLPVSEIQKKTFSKLFDKLAWEPDFKVCLHPQKEIVLSRIAKRGRVEEQDQDDFFDKCYDRYDALINENVFDVVYFKNPSQANFLVLIKQWEEKLCRTEELCSTQNGMSH